MLNFKIFKNPNFKINHIIRFINREEVFEFIHTPHLANCSYRSYYIHLSRFTPLNHYRHVFLELERRDNRRRGVRFTVSNYNGCGDKDCLRVFSMRRRRTQSRNIRATSARIVKLLTTVWCKTTSIACVSTLCSTSIEGTVYGGVSCFKT